MSLTFTQTWVVRFTAQGMNGRDFEVSWDVPEADLDTFLRVLRRNGATQFAAWRTPITNVKLEGAA